MGRNPGFADNEGECRCIPRKAIQVQRTIQHDLRRHIALLQDIRGELKAETIIILIEAGEQERETYRRLATTRTMAIQ